MSASTLTVTIKAKGGLDLELGADNDDIVISDLVASCKLPGDAEDADDIQSQVHGLLGEIHVTTREDGVALPCDEDDTGEHWIGMRDAVCEGLGETIASAFEDDGELVGSYETDNHYFEVTFEVS